LLLAWNNSFSSYARLEVWFSCVDDEKERLT
jgi:hypothetical protein